MLTTFEITTDKKGILVSKKRGDKVLKETYALSAEHANIIRDQWINQFWGFPAINYN